MREAGWSADSVTVSVRVLFLSTVKDAVGTREIELSLACGATLATVAEELATRFALQVPSADVMATLNGRGWTQLPEGLDTSLATGDVIHVFPPVSGG